MISSFVRAFLDIGHRFGPFSELLLHNLIANRLLEFCEQDPISFTPVLMRCISSTGQSTQEPHGIGLRNVGKYHNSSCCFYQASPSVGESSV